MSAPVFYTGGALFSALMEWGKRRLLPPRFPGVFVYLLSNVIYALAGAGVMWLYLVTVFHHFQIQTTWTMVIFLRIGACAALYMYHVSIMLTFLHKLLLDWKA